MTRTDRGHRLQALRRKHRLTRKDIAEITGASYRTVCHWLVDPAKNEYRPPSESALRLVELQAAKFKRRRFMQ